jgi:hypothetical protein
VGNYIKVSEALVKQKKKYRYDKTMIGFSDVYSKVYRLFLSYLSAFK